MLVVPIFDLYRHLTNVALGALVALVLINHVGRAAIELGFQNNTQFTVALVGYINFITQGANFSRFARHRVNSSVTKQVFYTFSGVLANIRKFK